jgi:hypothetical protein
LVGPARFRYGGYAFFIDKVIHQTHVEGLALSDDERQLLR